ncbi:MAG: hypothetical protein ABI867_08515 [Kofleriaceae bacterium]
MSRRLSTFAIALCLGLFGTAALLETASAKPSERAEPKAKKKRTKHAKKHARAKHHHKAKRSHDEPRSETRKKADEPRSETRKKADETRKKPDEPAKEPRVEPAKPSDTAPDTRDAMPPEEPAAPHASWHEVGRPQAVAETAAPAITSPRHVEVTVPAATEPAPTTTSAEPDVPRANAAEPGVITNAQRFAELEPTPDDASLNLPAMISATAHVGDDSSPVHAEPGVFPDREPTETTPTKPPEACACGARDTLGFEAETRVATTDSAPAPGLPGLAAQHTAADEIGDQGIGATTGLATGGRVTAGGLRITGHYLYQLSSKDWFDGTVGFTFGGGAAGCFRDREDTVICDHGIADGGAIELAAGVRRMFAAQGAFRPFARAAIGLAYVRFDDDELSGLAVPLHLGGGVRARVSSLVALVGMGEVMFGFGKFGRGLGTEPQLGINVSVGAEFRLK